MTKKHFEIIARVIREAYEDPRCTKGEADTVELLADRLAEEFQALNERFDADRFLKACGVTDK